jgi:hypothetical protein
MRSAFRQRVAHGRRSQVGVGGASIALAALLVHAACATGEIERPAPPPLTLFAPDAQATLRLACVQTECPPPYLTCPGERGLCNIDPRSNIEHCGACNAPCPTAPLGTGSFVCSEGQCRLACPPFQADCNGVLNDGCETSTISDPSNCGACGNSCDGGLCWLGACGCPNGLAQCADSCVDLSSDGLNCGACGVVCKPPEASDPRWICGPSVTPKNTTWVCGEGACKLSCKPEKADCNQDFCGDGCETSTASDPKNCGACGNECLAGQECVGGKCLCPNDGTTLCRGECVNLQNDPLNCGSCGSACLDPNPKNGGPQCIQGECVHQCYPGFADCDGDLDNGCETNIRTSQRNCGSCGTECDIAAGQPCVEGVCLTKPCIGEQVN